MPNTGITGKVVDGGGAPIPGLTVQAYDVDVFTDTLLGTATTSSTGDFTISYTAGAYGAEPNPDLKLVILDSSGVLVRDTREYPDVTEATLQVGNVRVSHIAVLTGTLPGGPAFRTCCVVGVSRVFDIGASTAHVFGSTTDPVGYIYTCAAGFIDLGHLRDLADLTYFYFKQLAKRVDHDKGLVPKGTHFDPWHYDGDVEVLRDIPETEVINVARSMAYDQGTFHEIYSYWVDVPGMHSSAFSPEDLVSNWLGTYVGGRAISAGGPFNAGVASELSALLAAVRGQPSATTAAAQGRVTAPAGTWFAGNFWTDDTYLRRRNFAVRPAGPWLIPGFAPCSGIGGSMPPFDLDLSLRGYYEMTLEVDALVSIYVSPTTMKSSELEESGPHIQKIKQHAAAQYGAGFETP